MPTSTANAVWEGGLRKGNGQFSAQSGAFQGKYSFGTRFEGEKGTNLLFGLSTAPPDQDTKGFIEFRWTFINDASPFKLALGFMHQL